MLLQKTEKARTELRPGVRTLGQRERSLLLLADGNRSMLDFHPLFDGLGEQIVLSLVSQGYLEAVGNSVAATPVATPAPQPLPEPGATGKRSLAATRMFLFDTCERLFARRDPLLAESMREALRNARDRGTMLAVSAVMIAEVERAAGPERARSISDNIALLLPPE